MFVLISALVLATQIQIDTSKVSQAMLAELQRTRAPGAAIGIVVGDRLVFARGYGSASSERLDSVTPRTLFRVGSVTKVMTGLTALGSQQAGRVAFQQPIGNYWPALHPNLRRLTLQQLLTHTAGMAQLASAYGPSDEEALQKRVALWNDSILFSEPGEVYSYSSPGYWLAAAVLERAENARYAALVSKYLFDPLGMRSSTFDPLVAFTRPIALDHRRNAQGETFVVRPYPNDASTWPGGSAFSSVDDLSKLAIALLNNGKVAEQPGISPAMAQAVMTKQTQNAATDCGYTFGLGFCTQRADTINSHYGFRSGSGAVFTVVPSKRVAVIILANIGGAIFFQTERAVLDMFGVQREAQATPVVRDIPKTEYPRLTGAYVSGSDTLRILERDAKLVLAAPDPQSLRMGKTNELFVVDQQGNPVGRFVLLQSTKGNWFLSDGLNAFRRTATTSRTR
jgi:CubicO group peptidase (beta-lactamase class C family)